jgi:hypothetical protein
LESRNFKFVPKVLELVLAQLETRVEKGLNKAEIFLQSAQDYERNLTKIKLSTQQQGSPKLIKLQNMTHPLVLNDDKG